VPRFYLLKKASSHIATRKLAVKTNRIIAASGVIDPSKRAAAFEKLDWDIGNDPEASLSVSEIRSLILFIATESNNDVQVSLWSLVLRVPANESLKELCIKWLADYGNACRGYAMHYLRVRCPEMIPAIFKKYQDDTDPGVRYGLAKHMQRLNTGKAMDMMIGALLKAKGEELEVLSDEIEIMGNDEDLRKLILLDQEKGGGTNAAAVVDRLRSKLKKKGKK